jgi:hypothetical protein
MSAPVCDCGREAVLVGGAVIYPHRQDLYTKSFWQCAPCDAYVGCHPPAGKNGKGGHGDGTVPLGRLANAELRRWKSFAHRVFDPMWKDGEMRRKQAYRWLAQQLNIDFKDCHIGEFDVQTCKRVVEVCTRFTPEQ